MVFRVIKMVAAGSSKMLVTCYKTTWRHNPKDNNINLNCNENFKSQEKITSKSLNIRQNVKAETQQEELFKLKIQWYGHVDDNL